MNGSGKWWSIKIRFTVFAKINEIPGNNIAQNKQGSDIVNKLKFSNE